MKKFLFICFMALLIGACIPQQGTSFQTSDSPVKSSPPIATKAVESDTTKTRTPDVDLTDLNNWVTIQDHASKGIVTKKEGEIKNYVFFIDPSIAKVTVRSPKSKNAESMVNILTEQDPSADCGFAGSIYALKSEDLKTVMYPYPIKTDIVTDLGRDTDEDIRTLYISDGQVWISKDHSESMLASAEFAISGITPANFDTSLYESWELIAVKGNQLIILTTNKSLPENIALLTKYGVSPDEMFFTFFPPQAGCYAMDWWQWVNPVGSAIFVTEP